MGRGIGHFQRSMLAVLETRGETSINEMQWNLLEGTRGDGPITKTLLNQCRHAVVGLVTRRELRVTKRHLRDLDEVIHVFPFKTLDPTVRTSRVKILPELCEHAARKPRRSLKAIEMFALRNRKPLVAQLADQWLLIEDRLAEQVVERRTREWAVPLITRGRAVFLAGHDTSEESFEQLVDVAERQSPIRVVSDLRMLLDLLFPPDERNASRLRNQVHSILEMPNYGPSRLREPILRKLSENHDLREHATDRILTREVLQRFTFMTRTRRPRRPRPSE